MYLDEKNLFKLREEVGRVLADDGRKIPYIHNVKEFTKTSFSKELFKKSLTKEDFKTLFNNVVVHPSVTQFILERIGTNSLKDYFEMGGLSNLYLLNHLNEDMEYADITNFMDDLQSEDGVLEIEIMLSEIQNNVVFKRERFQLTHFFLSIIEKYHVATWSVEKEEREKAIDFIHSNFAEIYQLLFNGENLSMYENHHYFRSVGNENMDIDFFRAREVCTKDVWKIEELFDNMLRLPVLSYDYMMEYLSEENIHELQDILFATTLFLFSEKVHKDDLDKATRALLSLVQILDDEDLHPIFRIFPDWFTPQSSYSYWVDDFGSADFLKNLRLNNSTKEERKIMFDKVLKHFISVIVTRRGEMVYAEALRNLGYRDEEWVEIIKIFLEHAQLPGFSYFQDFFPQEPSDRRTYPGPLTIRYIYAWDDSEYSVNDYTEHSHKMKEKTLRKKVYNKFVETDKLYLTWDMAADYKFLYELSVSAQSYYYYRIIEVFNKIRVSALKERAFQLFEDVSRKTGWNSNRNLYSDWGKCIPANEEFAAFYEDKDLMLQYKSYIYLSKLATIPEIAKDLHPFVLNRVRATRESWNVDSYLTPYMKTLKETDLYTKEEKLQLLAPILRTSHTDFMVSSEFSYHPRRLEVRLKGVEECTVEELLKAERGC